MTVSTGLRRCRDRLSGDRKEQKTMFVAKVKDNSGQLREMYGSLQECVRFVEGKREKDDTVSIQIKSLQKEDPDDERSQG